MAAKLRAVALAIGTNALCGLAVATDAGPASTSNSSPAPTVTMDEGPMVAPVKRMKPEMPATKSKAVVPDTRSAVDTPAKATTKPSATDRR